MDVQYLHRIAGHVIEDSVWISAQGRDAHVRSFGNLLRAVRPSSETGDHRAKPGFKIFGYGRVVSGNESENLVEVVERFGGLDHPHAGRCFLKTSST
jgi:hypothetical protein